MKKRIIISFIILLIVLIILGTVCFSFLYERNKTISLMQDNITIEYGETYNPTIEELIDLSKYDFINLDKINIENNVTNGDETDYPDVGVYSIYVYYRNIELVQSVEIIDSTPPDVTIDEEISLEYEIDLDNYDFSSYVEIVDLSETNYSIDLSNVNNEVAGTYIAILTAKDIYDNEIKKEFNITIQEKIEEINADDSSNNTNDTEEKTSNKTNTSATSQNTNQTTNTSTNNNSQTSTTNEQQSTSQVEETTTQIQTSIETAYWCTDGGTHHVAGDDVNEHGYYSTWDLAWSACQEYMKNLDNSCHYKVDQCWCGLYYFWVEEN